MIAITEGLPFVKFPPEGVSNMAIKYSFPSVGREPSSFIRMLANEEKVSPAKKVTTTGLFP